MESTKNISHTRRKKGHLLFSLGILFALFIPRALAEFNYEVEKRVLERIDDYMNGPRIANGITAKFRANGGFPHDLQARDRDAYLRFCYSMMQEFKFALLYYGLEDGTFLGYGNGWGTYREPRNSGYDVNDLSMQHYYHACVNRTDGANQNCDMEIGSSYVKCIRNCGLMKCADEETQACNSALVSGFNYDSTGELAHCNSPHAVKWCRQYAIEEVVEGDTLGFVPRTYHCHGERGVFTEEPGKAMKEGFLEEVTSPLIELGDCEFGDEKTKVERYEVGPFVYCGGGICDYTFDGGYRSRDYDPRYRSWYSRTKELQVPNWSPPYAFFSNLDLGITYSHPIYMDDEEHGRHIFEGVLAVDYTFEDITKFLVEGYKDSKTMIVVFEESEPNYIVASSTGRKAASKVLKDDPKQPCPDDSDGGIACIVVRDTMNNLKGYSMDALLVRAFNLQNDNDYPRELLTVNGLKSDGEDGEDIEEQLYIVQSSYYRPGGDLNWIILVISPAGEGTADSITKDNPLFGLVCVVAGLGFCLCLAMFYLFYRQRHERAVILADWRFTSAFLLGCALLNISSFTLLGENTDTLCLARMWSFHFLFALALSPLFVKVWRMWRMIGSVNRHPTIVNHTTAAVLSTPIVALQVIILLIFTFADPPESEQIIDIEEGIVTQRVICSQESNAFMIVMLIFEAGLVMTGCGLAYVTRNMDSQFGEAKQLMFSMYNIAFIGVITTIIIITMDIDATGEIVLRSIGVFWGTFFSSAAFVMPRLLQVKEERKHGSSIMKQPQKGATANPKSRVRFSMDDDKSSLQSENQKSQATDKKSNVSSLKNDIKDIGSANVEKPTSLVLDNAGSSDRRGSSKMGDDSFFTRGTGWSTFESPDSHGVGRWSDHDQASGELNSNAEEVQSGQKDENDSGTANTGSSEDDCSPLNSNMTTIQETEASESDLAETAPQSEGSGEDKC